MNRHGLARPAAARTMAERPPAPTVAAPMPRPRTRRRPARRSSWRSIPYLTLALLAGLGLLMVLTSRKPSPDDAPAAAAPSRADSSPGARLAAVKPAADPAPAKAAAPQPTATGKAAAEQTPAAKAVPAEGRPRQAAAEAARAGETAADDGAAAAEPADGTWERLADAPAAFILSALPDTGVTAGLVELPQREETVLHTGGGGRDDAVGLGTVEGEPLLRLSVYRPGSEAAASPSFYIDLARRAGEAGLWVQRLAAIADIDTRFGAVAAADVVFGSRQGERACIAFRRLGTEPAVRISGWLCGAGLKQPTPAELACVLEGVRWTRTEEPDLAAVFNGKAVRPGCKPAAPAATGSIASATATAAATAAASPTVEPAAGPPPRKHKRRHRR